MKTPFLITSSLVHMHISCFLLIFSSLSSTPSLSIDRREGRKKKTTQLLGRRILKKNAVFRKSCIQSLYSCLDYDCTQRIFECCSQREACVCIPGISLISWGSDKNEPAVAQIQPLPKSWYYWCQCTVYGTVFCCCSFTILSA